MAHDHHRGGEICESHQPAPSTRIVKPQVQVKSVSPAQIRRTVTELSGALAVQGVRLYPDGSAELFTAAERVARLTPEDSLDAELAAFRSSH